MRRSIANRVRPFPPSGKNLVIMGSLLLMIITPLPLHGPVAVVPTKIRDATVGGFVGPYGAGYIANYTSLAQSVDGVRGVWKVPTVQPSSETTAVLESISIGFGDTIIQLGTNQYSKNGAVVYGAWYWVAPEGGGNPTTITQLDGKIGAGKNIGAAIVRGSGYSWTLIMVSATPGATPDSFQLQVTHTPGVPVAGWVVQPVQQGSPLANFGNVAFSSTNATIDRTQSRLDQLQNQKLTLVDPSLQCTLAGTSDIDPSYGDNFEVSYVQATAPCTTQNTSNVPNLGLIIPLVIGGIAIAVVIVLVAAFVILSLRKKSGATGPLTWQNLGGTAPPSAARLCSNCHSPLQPGARFCDICGKQIL
jgi:hypothetical protein